MSEVAPCTKRPLKVGLGLPTWTESVDGKTPTWRDILTLARYAEEIGFDSLWVPDNFFYLTETGAYCDFWECGSLLSALAVSTSRVTIGSFVSYSGYRNPLLLAKMAGTIDEISGGRFVLGLGAGVISGPTEAAGFPTEQRYKRLEETLIILQHLFQHGSVHFEGQFYQIREYELLLRGPRPGGPPVLIGSVYRGGPRLVKLAARYAQQWNMWLEPAPQSLELLPAIRKRVDGVCLECQRAPQTLERSIGAGVVLEGVPTKDPHFAHIAPISLVGTAEMVAESLLEMAHSGFSEVQVFLNAPTPGGLEAFAPVFNYLEKASVIVP
jgi:alkanesulfonate monooxygenase SsuD/methylene tetrahydromethanopterin reductase-like flavin-dependent oxidoreductase (luciferase family)